MTLRAARGFLLRACLLLVTLTGLLTACGKPAPAPPVLEVQYAGCWAFYLPDQVCALVPERELTLWVKTTPPDRKVELHVGGRPLKLPKEEKVNGGGTRYQLSIPKPADRLTVEVLSPDGSRGPSWFLRLAEPEQPSWWNEVKELIDSKKSLEAQRRLEQIQRSAPRGERSFTWLPLANLAHREGNDEKEELYLKKGIAADRSENRWSGLATKEPRLAALHIKLGSFGEARRILQTLKLPPKAAANDKCNVSFYQGVLAEKTSNYDAALKRLQETADLAQRVGLSKFEGAAGQMLALVYQQLGRSRDAARLYAKQAALDLKSSCDLGTFWTNAGWFQLMEREAGNTAENPALALQNALAEFQKNQCSPEQILTAHQNLALAYQQQGQWSEASRELTQAQALAEHSNLLELLWQDDLEARVALHEGHPELALDLYEKLEKRSERAASPAGLLQALLGRAKAHIASGQQQEAINVLAKADRQIEEQSRHIPVHEGLDTFFAYQEAATRLYLKLLLEGKQQQKAFDLARKSRSRLLRQLAVRDRLRQLDPERRKAWLDSLAKYNTLREAVESDAAKRWQLAGSEEESALAAEARKLKEAQDDLDLALRDLDALRRNGEEELAPPAHGEVILAYHPLPEKRWVAFAATERGVVVATFELAEKMPEDLKQRARLLLTPTPPFQSAIASATSVKILPYGPLRSVDFHALPFTHGQPLLATKLVAYSLDLPVRSAFATRSAKNEALVVSNPTRDLRTADIEGETVAAAIRRWPGSWTLTHLKGSGAKSKSVSEALARASFFHYAGHGIFGGFAGWSSELPLAAQSRLTLSDVLTLSHTPDSIVLSACDAGRTSAEAPGEGVGLANAFLLAGAREVVAARELVPDASANELMAEMYRHWQPGEDLPHQLRRAQLACSRMNPSPCPSWASFRLLVP